MTIPAQTSEYRPQGGRNYVRLHDYVRITSTPGKRDGFIGRVTRIDVDQLGAPQAVHVAVARTMDGRKRHGKAGMGRVLHPERVERVDQKRLARIMDEELVDDA